MKLSLKTFNSKVFPRRLISGGGGGGANNRLLLIGSYCFPYCFLEIYVGGQNQQSGHKPEKKHGKLREFEKLSESQGNLREISIFEEKPVKLRENVRYVA